MAPNADPWRTLGLTPGATQDEIRRAYRRLAKVNHPDAAGDAALPRFLAIQSAYEQLAGPGRIRRVGARPPARPTEPASPREPWRADPDRARASGRADGRRTPGARPAGPNGDPSSRPRSGDRGAGPGAGRDGGGPGRAGTSQTQSGPAGPEERAPGTGRARRSTGRRRPPNTATPGSTSYEGADQEPFEPGWSGATWYGASSGTYWTINPTEYADPRKHGPEYQARARRAAGGAPVGDGAAATGAAPEEPLAGEAPEEPLTGEPAGVDRDPPPATGEAPPPPPPRPTSASTGRPPRGEPSGSGPSSPLAGGWSRASGRDVAGAGSTVGVPDPTDSDRASGPGPLGRRGWAAATAEAGAGAAPLGRTGAGAPPGAGWRSWIDPPAAAGGFRGPSIRRPATPLGRFAMALVGWIPLGVFTTAVIDQMTGCGRYAASCPEVSAPGTWILQAALVLLLLAAPAVAVWSAHGAIASLVAGVPTAVVLSAAGGTNVRETSGPLLLVILAIAYLGGVVYGLLVRRRPGRA